MWSMGYLRRMNGVLSKSMWLSQRRFSTYYRQVREDTSEILQQYQQRFEQDPLNIESAYLYLRVSL